MRFSTFTKHAELIISRLETINKQVTSLSEASVINALTDQQVHKLKLLSLTASQKNSEFEKQINKLFAAIPEDIEEKTVAELENRISDLYINIQSVCHTLQPPAPLSEPPSDPNNLVSQTHSVSQTVKLPQIKLPTFSGQLEQWVAFHGLFESTIHKNESISNVEKFTYLLSCLSDEPLNLIKSMPINCANYIIAWQTLIKRYDNSRLLITLHTNNILDLPQLPKHNTKQLRNFLSLYNENYQALKSLGHDIASESLFLTIHILRKFDNSLRSEFEHKRIDSKQVPKIEDVIKFLEDECSQQEAASLTTMSNAMSMPQNRFSNSPRNVTASVKPNSGLKPNKLVMFSSAKPPQNCTYCTSTFHNIYKCNDFNALTPQNRHSFIKGKDLCQNCFGTHKIESCKSLHSCRVCLRRHHTLLHFTKTEKPTYNNKNHRTVGYSTSPKPASEQPLEESATLVGVTTDQSSMVLLATALVNLTTSNGHNIVVRAILDSASQSTIISEHCASMLQLQRSRLGVPEITGISAARVKPKGLVFVNISSLSGTILADSHPVIVLDRISSNLPRVQISPSVKNRLKDLTLADPTFDVPGPIDVLIGADLFSQTILGPAVNLGDGMPHTWNTIFGYVVIGHAPTSHLSQQYTGISTLLSTNELDLHATLQRFWALEEPPPCTKASPLDEECEKQFLETHSRDNKGRYICRLPFKENPSLLGESSTIAKRTFFSLERRFQSQPELKSEYVRFINEYETSGHMKICPSVPLTAPHYFLPHHGVFKDGKIRVVFNGSAPTSTGVSLNSIQHQGEKLHNEIPDIIFRFRQRKIAFACDIKQMFRMISIHEKDQCFQLIFWRENSSLPLRVYQLTTVTYGMSSSPFLANRVIQQLLQDEGRNHPLAAKTLQQQIYVDDVLLSCDTTREALELQQDMIGLLKKGGFELRKWMSNDKRVLEHLNPEHCTSPLVFKSCDQPFFSLLGLKWNPDTDTFAYIIDKPSTTLTKRALLSTIAKIYDVSGMLAPLIFWAKSLMQHVWTLGLDWDTPLPDEVAKKWCIFTQELPQIEHFRINRHLPLADAINTELHGFSDASELGFAAAVYLRTEDVSGNVTVNLLIAKSRVAPLKRTTVPRLELCGAHILSKLMHYCVKQISENFKINSVTAWCDSTVALSWIHTPSYKLKLYVANRVAQIQELTPSCIWRHVPTQDNPADCASRGLTASHLIHNDLWWYGPQWLKSDSTSWPHSSFRPIYEDELPETKSITLNLMTTAEETEWDLLKKFSKWTTLLHVMSYVLRFISCLKGKRKITHPLTSQELKDSHDRICWLVQKSAFSEDIKLLQNSKTCSNRLQRLAPFLDESKLIRVGGRLKNSNLSYSAKHQIVLPKNHAVVQLIIDHHHRNSLHAGPQQLQAFLQETYWILSARSIIRSRIFRCIRCFKTKPKSTFPIMGDLPSGRVVPTRCFNVSAVDYAGPYTVKIYRLRKIQPLKVYLCLFICFASKAIHLEVVTDLTTEAFIASLTRFISRRGSITDLYSDCGTNFIGTASSLKKCFQDLIRKPETQHFAEVNHLNFHFIPPRAPHQGGLWERAVKSAKYHLTRVIGEQILTYEEFITLTTRVEAMLNSRPITPLSADPHDPQPLTPGHFLTGGPLTSLIEPHLQDTTHLQRWKLVQSFAQHLWTRWQKEYLHTLQERSKWTKPQDNLKVGDLVVIHEDHSAPLSWKTGRITGVSPGKDGIVRVVHLKTPTKTLTRAAVKVSRLPIC